MQYIKKQIENGHLELAKMNSDNQPVPMYTQTSPRDYTELEEKQNTLSKRALLLQKLKTLSRDEKEEWRHLKKLRANELYKTEKLNQAMDLYLQALLGLDTGEDRDDNVRKSDNEFKYSILLNIATCLYKLKEYQKGVEMCNKILDEEEGRCVVKAYFKKANLLLAASKYEQVRSTCFQGLKCLQTHKQKDEGKQITKNDFIKIVSAVENKTTSEKTMYKKMFVDSDEDEDEDEENLLQKNSQGKESKERVLYYNDSLWGRILDCCSASFTWTRSLLSRSPKNKEK